MGDTIVRKLKSVSIISDMELKLSTFVADINKFCSSGLKSEFRQICPFQVLFCDEDKKDKIALVQCSRSQISLSVSKNIS